MWLANRKSKADDGVYILLQVFLGEHLLASIAKEELPTEKLITAKLPSGHAPLRFQGSGAASARRFDLSSVFEEGGRFLYLSIRVGKTFAVQPDCIITDEEVENPQVAFQKGAKALRFQPFMLPEFTGDKAALIGKGLFFRGLHYAGTITRGNVSALCICDVCERSFRLQSFHAGFSNLTYLYCSGGPHTLVASSYIKDAPPTVGRPDLKSIEAFERRLPKCRQCGGSFAYYNALLCPHCRSPFIDFKRFPEEREKEYYGNYLYGSTLQRFEELPT